MGPPFFGGRYISKLEFRKTQVTYNTNIDFTDTYEKIIELEKDGLVNITTPMADEDLTGSKGSAVFIFNSVESCKIQLSVNGIVTFNEKDFEDFLKAKTILNGIAKINDGDWIEKLICCFSCLEMQFS